MRTPLPTLALMLGMLLPAQDSPPPAPAAPGNPAAADLAAAKARLATALAKTASVADTAFTVTWGPANKKKAQEDPFLALMGGRTAGKVTGSWHADQLRLLWDGENDDELLLTGRRALAKDANSDWKLRHGRFADGNKLDFVPDPAPLLQMLASWDLAITQRSAGSLDDRPVEVVSATLSADQVADAVWSGLLPEAITQAHGGGAVFRIAGAMGAGGARPAPPTPTTTIDVAFHLDPGTNLVHQVQFRGWTKADGRMAAGQVIAVGARAVNVVGAGGGDDEEGEEETKEEAAKADAPLVYENGLPVRPRQKVSVSDCTIRLAEHGKKAAAELTDAQKKLLGR